MPIQKGSASFSRYRVEAGSKAKRLSELLRAHAFAPLDLASGEERAQGFVELEDPDAVEFAASSLWLGEIAVFSFRIDEVRIPAAALRAALETWRKQFVREQGRPPGRKEKADAKDELKHMLRARYPLSSKRFDLSWDTKQGVLHLWAGARKAVDEVQAALEKMLQLELRGASLPGIAARLDVSLDALQPTLLPEEAADAA